MFDYVTVPMSDGSEWFYPVPVGTSCNNRPTLDTILANQGLLVQQRPIISGQHWSAAQCTLITNDDIFVPNTSNGDSFDPDVTTTPTTPTTQPVVGAYPTEYFSTT